MNTGTRRHGRARAIVAALGFGVACANGASAPEARRMEATPGPWPGPSLPAANLQRILPDTNEHGIYADYGGDDREALMAEVAAGLERAGYRGACTAVDGMVLGFSNGTRQLALKVDQVGVLGVSLFDAQGRDPILHGVCFGRYREGAWERLDQAQKEKLAQSLEASGDRPAMAIRYAPDAQRPDRAKPLSLGESTACSQPWPSTTSEPTTPARKVRAHRSDYSRLRPSGHAVLIAEVTLSAEGWPTEALVVRSASPEIDGLALQDMEKSTYEPARRNGVPIESCTTVVFRIDVREP